MWGDRKFSGLASAYLWLCEAKHDPMELSISLSLGWGSSIQCGTNIPQFTVVH